MLSRPIRGFRNDRENEKTAGGGRTIVEPGEGASDFPDALEQLTAGERGILRPYLEAQIMGQAHDYEQAEGLQLAMHNYLNACVQRDQAMRAAGLPMRPITEALRDRPPRNTALQLAELATERRQATE